MKRALLQILSAVGLLIIIAEPARSADPCDMIRTFADRKQPAREIFVSAASDNSTGDGSQSKPYDTVSRALQVVRAGDAIRLLPGEYPPGTSIRGVAGTANAPIWIGGVRGQPRPVIKGGSVAIQLSKVGFLVLENVEIDGARGNGINCDDGGEYANSNATRHVVFRNLSIRNIGTGRNNDSLKLSGVNDYFVLDCEFAAMSVGGSGIDQVGCHRGIIARCTFSDAQGQGGNAIQCKGGSEDIEIRQNRFVNAGGRAINIGGSTGFQFFRPPLTTNAHNYEAKNIRVIANLFCGADAPIVFVGAVNSLVANNTIIEPRRWILRILQETVSKGGYTFLPSGRSQFVNNLVYVDRSQISSPVNVGPHTDAASFEFAHNLWYSFHQPNQFRPTLPAPETSGVYGLDPKFHNALANDYSLGPASPAAGKARKLPNVKADLLGGCYADPPTIGAFEAKTRK